MKYVSTYKRGNPGVNSRDGRESGPGSDKSSRSGRTLKQEEAARKFEPPPLLTLSVLATSARAGLNTSEP